LGWRVGPAKQDLASPDEVLINMYYVYAIRSLNNNDIYIGYSTDLKQRFKSHNHGSVQSTKINRPWELIYYEAYRSKNDATKREKQLKWHKPKEDLIIQIKNSLR